MLLIAKIFKSMFINNGKRFLNYRDDISKYARGEKKNKIRALFDSVPTQLAKENKKFQYALLEKENKNGMEGNIKIV